MRPLRVVQLMAHLRLVVPSQLQMQVQPDMVVTTQLQMDQALVSPAFALVPEPRNTMRRLAKQGGSSTHHQHLLNRAMPSERLLDRLNRLWRSCSRVCGLVLGSDALRRGRGNGGRLRSRRCRGGGKKRRRHGRVKRHKLGRWDLIVCRQLDRKKL